MKRLHVTTCGINSWRERLANPNTQWRRQYSAFEAAISWELATNEDSNLPGPIYALLNEAFGEPHLLLAVAEHKVVLPGGNAASQNDVWGLVKSNKGTVSLSIEAKAREAFGNNTLGDWLEAGATPEAQENRQVRWTFLLQQLPETPNGSYFPVKYQLLHRCASAVIEARRFGLKHAAFIIQAFNTPDYRFLEFATFCQSIGLEAARGGIQTTNVGEIELAIGWADCPLASDHQIAIVVSR